MPGPEDEQQAPPEKEKRNTARRIAKTAGNQAVRRIAVQAATRVAAAAILNPYVIAGIAILIFFIIIIMIIILLLSGDGGGFGGGGATGDFASQSASLCPSTTAGPSTTVEPNTTPSPDPCTPSADNCNGKYSSYMQKNPWDKSNYGDPQCDFTQEKAKAQLEQQLPQATADLFYRVIGRESSYIPVNWVRVVGNVQTPNPYGAWGLYQMGSRFKANNSYDHGDIHWQSQINNAVGYLRSLNGEGYRYWQAWRDLAGNAKYPI